MRISDWSSDVCSSDLGRQGLTATEYPAQTGAAGAQGLVDKQTEQRRYEVQRGHAKLFDQLRAAVRVTVFAGASQDQLASSEVRRVGEECVSTCRSWWSP